MVYGRYRRHYRRRGKSFKRVRRGFRRSIRRTFRRRRARYRRYRRGSKVVSMFMRTYHHFKKLKVTFALLPSSNTYNSTTPGNAAYGPFRSSFSSNVMGSSEVWFIDMGFIEKFCGPAFAYPTQWEALYDYISKFRWYKFSGVKVTFTPRMATVATPIASYNVTGNVGSPTEAKMQAGQDGFGSTVQSAAASLIVGDPVYDDMTRRCTGFAIPYLSLKSRPFTSSINITDVQTPNIQKCFDSGYRRLVFIPGKTTSVYYKSFKGTGDLLFNALTGDVSAALRRT